MERLVYRPSRGLRVDFDSASHGEGLRCAHAAAGSLRPKASVHFDREAPRSCSFSRHDAGTRARRWESARAPFDPRRRRSRTARSSAFARETGGGDGAPRLRCSKDVRRLRHRGSGRIRWTPASARPSVDGDDRRTWLTADLTTQAVVAGRGAVFGATRLAIRGLAGRAAARWSDPATAESWWSATERSTTTKPSAGGWRISGRVVAAATDVAVIPGLYLELGDRFVERLAGVFAARTLGSAEEPPPSRSRSSRRAPALLSITME